MTARRSFPPLRRLPASMAVIAETGRITDRKIELSESQKLLLDQKLTLIDDVIQDGYHPVVTVVYFVPDALKAGGSYREFIGKVRQVEPLSEILFFSRQMNAPVAKR